jgi:hypothetical protein
MSALASPSLVPHSARGLFFVLRLAAVPAKADA